MTTEPLTQGQVEELREALKIDFMLNADIADALCDMALFSLRQAEPVAWERYIGDQFHSLSRTRSGWNENYCKPLYARPTAAPAGCVVAPKEPTKEMVKAGYRAGMVGDEIAYDIYRAMIAAVPGEKHGS